MKVIVFFLIFLLFALVREYKEQPNCYLLGQPKDNDGFKTIRTKIEICLRAETKAIKWRRCLIVAVISTGLIFILVHSRVPENKETILYTAIIYSILYLSMERFSDCISTEAVRCGLTNLRKMTVLQVDQTNPNNQRRYKSK